MTKVTTMSPDFGGTEISGAEVEYKVLDPRLKDLTPSYATPGSAAVDLCACIDHPIYLMPGEVRAVSAGFALHIKDTRYAGLILPRSGLGVREGLVVANLVGLMDSDYQGPYMVALWNRNLTGEAIAVTPMQRVAQLVLVPVVRMFFKEVDSFEPTQRGAGGYGSTGRQ
jgi:dUTP pyrophosphatase